MNKVQRENLLRILIEVYEDRNLAKTLIEEIKTIAKSSVDDRNPALEIGFNKLDQRALCLITYANTFTSPNKSPLQALRSFFSNHNLSSVFSSVHLLPFFPWDTDRGFSVKDYYAVESTYGSWEDVTEFSNVTQLMFDFVANHASIDNPLVQGGLIAEHIEEEDPDWNVFGKYKGFVITYHADALPSMDDIRAISRPRAFPVLTPYRVIETPQGKCALLGEALAGENVIGSGYTWTTFSREDNADGSPSTKQVDLNYSNPQVLLEALRILFFYIQHGASHIRLDAIGYIWKRLGSLSLHEPECHHILEAVNLILKIYAPRIVTISEVNERQSSAFKYLGTRERPEADMAYQFTHFPLAVHAVLNGCSYYYSNWLRSVDKFDGRQFTTVLGSHDGLGMKPLRGVLPKQQITRLGETLAFDHGGLPNYAILPGGKRTIYEICATPWQLINGAAQEEEFDTKLKRYLVVAALGMSIPGLPAMYINGLLGTNNYAPPEGLDENRTVNRESFDLEEISARLVDDMSQESQVFRAISQIVSKRREYPHFSPGAKLEVLDSESDMCVSFKLTTPLSSDPLIVLVNVANEKEIVTLYVDAPKEEYRGIFGPKDYRILSANSCHVTLEPYEICWLI